MSSSIRRRLLLWLTPILLLTGLGAAALTRFNVQKEIDELFDKVLRTVAYSLPDSTPSVWISRAANSTRGHFGFRFDQSDLGLRKPSALSLAFFPTATLCARQRLDHGRMARRSVASIQPETPRCADSNRPIAE